MVSPAEAADRSKDDAEVATAAAAAAESAVDAAAAATEEETGLFTDRLMAECGTKALGAE